MRKRSELAKRIARRDRRHAAAIALKAIAIAAGMVALYAVVYGGFSLYAFIFDHRGHQLTHGVLGLLAAGAFYLMAVGAIALAEEYEPSED